MISYEYLKVITFMCFSFGLAYLLLFVSLKISSKDYDAEKLSAYECGFIPVGDARQPFHVRFYLVGILFLLFDLEVVFLLLLVDVFIITITISGAVAHYFLN